MNNLKTFAFAFVALFGISMTAFATKKTSDVPIPKVEIRGGVYYLELDAATPYHRGIQHGTALKLVINKTLSNFENWLRNNANAKDPDQMISNFVESTGHIAAVKKELPDLYLEMKGIADGAEVDFNKLFVYQSFDELFLYLMKSGQLAIKDGHCTTTGIFNRTSLPNYVTHNNDIPTYHEGAVTVLKIKYPNSDLEILQQTFAGQIGQNGVNNYGVSVGVNTIADLPTTSYGIPVSFKVRKVLESKNTEQAYQYLKNTTAGTAMNFMIGDREKVIAVETWEGNAKILDQTGEQFNVHTNHSLQENAPVTFKMDPSSGGGSYGYTQQRFALAKQHLQQSSATIGLEGVKALKTTKPILVYPGSPTGRTIMCMIVEIPKTGNPILYTTPDAPNLHEHVKFEF
ncbi:C45 family peptidase [Persicobacter diffluens]|uniref:Peptidase C45 hydrolase domain-containing protein n=1 Tax=Persicobacter diffluens TaxID=981 RepID=A0AAN4VX67_9BACT|nr:hypothetical protein PEDI_11090 [Persicobacter diffluens]